MNRDYQISMGQNPLFDLGFMLMILGVAISFIAAILLVFRGAKGRARGGGIIMIGPFPIIFGSDAKTVKVLIVIAIFLMAVYLFLFFLPAMIG